MTDVTICIVSFGAPAYHAAAYQSVASALAHTDAEVLFLTDTGEVDVPDDSRVTHLPVLRPGEPTRRFMTKLEAWRFFLCRTATDVLILLDADAVFVRSTDSLELANLVAERDLAMVEQTRLLQMGWRRLDYWRHYCRTSLKAIDAHEKPPSVDCFRFFNSGFMACRRQGLGEFLEWADGVLPRVDFNWAAQRGVVLTDQDFVQFWTNNLHPEYASTLDWSWNHCPHWDTGFPRPGGRVVHFSNFYRAPTPEVIERMRSAGSGQNNGV